MKIIVTADVHFEKSGIRGVEWKKEEMKTNPDVSTQHTPGVYISLIRPLWKGKLFMPEKSGGVLANILS